MPEVPETPPVVADNAAPVAPVAPVEQSLTPEQAQHNTEASALEAFSKDQGQALPENFNSWSDYLTSLKEAQKGYTQARQEISDLKKEPEAPAVAEPEIPIPEELQIPVPEPDPEPSTAPVSQTDWDNWNHELIRSGVFSDTTKNEIKTRTGIDDTMLERITVTLKAEQREAFTQAAGTIGGPERLAKIFEWAGKNKTPAEVEAINASFTAGGLTRDYTLKGLAAEFDASAPTAPAPEPAVSNTASVNTSTTPATVQPYTKRTEYYAESSDTRMATPEYRDYVQARLAASGDLSILPL